MVIFAVRIHTAKLPRVAHLCTELRRCGVVGLFAMRGGGEAHGKGRAFPCGLEEKRTAKSAARQTF
jgi:hypothetical protein